MSPTGESERLLTWPLLAGYVRPTQLVSPKVVSLENRLTSPDRNAKLNDPFVGRMAGTKSLFPPAGSPPSLLSWWAFSF